jgi:[acyl-carrier-protein] S-malonyltransferase
MSTVFLFPGQGAQFPGMVKDICDAHPEAMRLVKEAEEISGEALSEWLWNSDASLLSRSDRSQLAITVASLAIAKVLEIKGTKADAVAGFSLGEYPALYTSGVLSFADTIRVVKERGRIMQEACEAIQNESSSSELDNASPGMAAVIGLETDEIIAILKEYSGEKGIVFPVNMNSPKQTVVAGTAEGLAVCEKLCKEKGARRFIRLQVAGPFHSPLMHKAAKDFGNFLETISFQNPKTLFFSNVTGDIIKSGEEAKRRAVEHITYPVLWTSVEKKIHAFFEESKSKAVLLEVGPGKVLSGLWRDSGYAEAITSIPCGTLEQIQSII